MAEELLHIKGTITGQELSLLGESDSQPYEVAQVSPYICRYQTPSVAMGVRGYTFYRESCAPQPCLEPLCRKLHPQTQTSGDLACHNGDNNNPE